jgi:hypothetical protein
MRMDRRDQQDRRKRGSDDQPVDRRRAQNSGHRGAAGGPAVAGRGGRPRFRRLRQPLIGLGLAGVAVPMVRATSGNEDDQDGAAAAVAPRSDDVVAAARSGAGDAEEALVDRIAITREQQERESQLDRAIDRYGISRDLAEDIYDIARESNIEPRLAFGLVKTGEHVR